MRTPHPTHLSWEEREGETRWLLVEVSYLTGSGVKLEGNTVQCVTLHHLQGQRSEFRGQLSAYI